MLVQRFVFQDRNVTWQSIKSKFKEAFAKEEDQKETTSIHEEDSKLLTKEVQDDENNDRK